MNHFNGHSTTRRPLLPPAALIATALVLTACGSSDATTTGAGTTEPAEPSAVSDTRTRTPVDTLTAFPQGSEVIDLDPADFTIDIDNPYWPMKPGNTWVFVETDSTGAREDVVVEVTEQTKMIANGVEARVILDTATENGVPIEITEDWYAQDRDGNIWYLGEYVTNYENGEVVDHDGSFEAGVDGAQAGIVMPANPEPGMMYRQEYYAGEAEDTGGVITVGEEQVEVPFGYFNTGVLMTRDLSPTDPMVQELKFYAPGVGPVLSVHTDGLGGRGTLISFTPGS